MVSWTYLILVKGGHSINLSEIITLIKGEHKPDTNSATLNNDNEFILNAA